MALVGLLCLVSCDEDKWTASRVSGDWYGDFGMYYEYQYNGRTYRYGSWDTKIRFSKTPFTDHGTGYQVDYYDQGPYRYISYTFHWQVKNHDIILTYPHNPEWNTTIYDYQIANGYFRGYFGDSHTRFNLQSLTDYDWNKYGSNDFYCDFNSGYNGYRPWYAPSRRDSVTTQNDETPAPIIIRRGCRFEDEAQQ